MLLCGNFHAGWYIIGGDLGAGEPTRIPYDKMMVPVYNGLPPCVKITGVGDGDLGRCTGLRIAEQSHGGRVAGGGEKGHTARNGCGCVRLVNGGRSVIIGGCIGLLHRSRMILCKEDVAVEHGHCIAALGVVQGGNIGVAVGTLDAVDDAGLYAPCGSVFGVGTDGLAVCKAAKIRLAGGVHLLIVRIAEQNGGQILTDDG